MDIVGLLRKERAVLMGKVNAVDTAIRLLGGGGNVRQAKQAKQAKQVKASIPKSSVPDERRRRISAALKAHWRKRGAQKK
jgi:hypothetical protein